MARRLSVSGADVRIDGMWESAKQRVGQRTAPKGLGGVHLGQVAHARNPNAKKVKFRQAERQKVQWDNLLARLSQNIALESGRQIVNVSISPAPSSPFAQGYRAVGFSVSGEKAWLRFDRWPLRPPGDTYTDEELGLMPEGFQQAIIARRLEPLVKRIESYFGVKVDIAGLTVVDDLEDLPFTAAISIEGSQAKASSLLLGLPRSLAGLAGAVLDQLPSAPNPVVESLDIIAKAEIGFVHLTVAEMESLGLGDVLFLSQYVRSERQLFRACFSRDVHLYLLHADSEYILQFLSSEALGITGDKNLDDLGDLEVEVTFSVGDVQVPMSYLRNIRPGFTVPTHRREDDLVGIHANGQKIGTGEIVEVGDKMGVRVLELFGQENGKSL